MFNDERDNLQINENAYFYRKRGNRALSQRLLRDVINAASSDRLGNHLYRIINETVIIGSHTTKYSLCIFKTQKNPSFIDPPIQNWNEIKLAYILIVEIENYVIISKKSVSRITELMNRLEPIDYSILLGVFISQDTSYEQFSLQNLNMSNSSMRTKSVSAVDLQENFSALGANTYMLNGIRVSTNNEKITLALNTSRINKFGAKQGLLSFINWSIRIKNKINLYQESENFTSIFAKPVDFEQHRTSLNPIGILFNMAKIIDKLDREEIAGFYYQYGDAKRVLDSSRVLNFFSIMFQVVNIGTGSIPIYSVKSNNVKDLFLKINKKSITVSSGKLRNIRIELDGEDDISLLTYLNLNNEYIISFDDVEMIYSNRKLFKDTKLLENIDQFMKVFEPYPALNSTTSEKGVVSSTSTGFDTGSVFRFVEDQFKDSYSYFICDDIGKEWADHIGVSDEEIVFFHSKSKRSQFSASDFQDVFGQAQKNLGNITPTWGQLDQKLSFWTRPYTSTQIDRLRTTNQGSIDDAVTLWKEALRNPNLTREVKIVVDFISMSDLKTRLDQLKAGTRFREQNEVVQILWFVSSLVASSQDAGVKCRIVCKP